MEKIMFSFSDIEKQDLVIGTLVFTIVELSVVISPLSFLANLNIDLILFLIVLGIASIPLFLLHEVAHKFSSQGYGLYSEFRLDKQMALLSLITVFLPVKIIAPGAVISAGSSYNRSISGRTAAAGPLTNLLLGGLFFLLIFFTNDYFRLILLYISKFTFDLALFNLLPFSILDGNKILNWNNYFYYFLFSVSFIMWLFHPFGLIGAVLF